MNKFGDNQFLDHHTVILHSFFRHLCVKSRVETKNINLKNLKLVRPTNIWTSNLQLNKINYISSVSISLSFSLSSLSSCSCSKVEVAIDCDLSSICGNIDTLSSESILF